MKQTNTQEMLRLPNFQKEDNSQKDPVFLELPLSIKNINKQGQLVRVSTLGSCASSNGGQPLGEQDFNYSRVQPFLPENASDKEIRIHNFLNNQTVYGVNVKEMIEDFSKTPTSNRLKQEFNKSKKNSSLFERRKNVLNSFSSLRSSPNRFDKPTLDSKSLANEPQVTLQNNASGNKLLRQSTDINESLGMSFGLAIYKKRLKVTTDCDDSPKQTGVLDDNKLGANDDYSNSSIHQDDTRCTSQEKDQNSCVLTLELQNSFSQITAELEGLSFSPDNLKITDSKNISCLPYQVTGFTQESLTHQDMGFQNGSCSALQHRFLQRQQKSSDIENKPENLLLAPQQLKLPKISCGNLNID
eukprot:403359300